MNRWIERIPKSTHKVKVGMDKKPEQYLVAAASFSNTLRTTSLALQNRALSNLGPTTGDAETATGRRRAIDPRISC
jgi:hypothetical protein